MGCASGVHLHFEVAVPDHPDDPIDGDGFIRGGSARNRVPFFSPGGVLVDGRSYTAEELTPLVVSPSFIPFGTVAVGASDSRRLVVGNSTGAPLRVRVAASSTAPFTWPAPDQTLPPGEFRTLAVAFHPINPGNAGRRLTATSTAPGNPHTVNLSGRTPAASPSPPPIPHQPLPPPEPFHLRTPRSRMRGRPSAGRFTADHVWIKAVCT